MMFHETENDPRSIKIYFDCINPSFVEKMCVVDGFSVIRQTIDCWRWLWREFYLGSPREYKSPEKLSNTYFFPDLSSWYDLLPIMTNTHMQRRINRGEDGDHPRDEVQEVLRGMHHSSEDFESLTMSEVSHWTVNGPRQPVRQHSIINCYRILMSFKIGF